jgi:replicative DNA helicase
VSLDRLPPQSVEAEQSVLGALLIDRDAVVEVAEILRPDDFYRVQHAEIYGAVLDLYERREPVDIVTVSEALERRDQLEHVGGSAYLTSLINLTPTAVNAVYYARIVERKAVLRNLIGAAGRIAGIGYEETADVDTSIDRAEQELFAVSQKRVASGFSQLRTLLHAAYDRLDYLHQHKGEISGITTGIRGLDAMTTGLQKSDLIILAARPSIGKTSLALNIAEYASVVQRKTVGVFSLEMSKEQLVLRLLSSVANIDSQRLRTGFLEEMDFTRLAPAMNALAEAPIYIDDTPNVSTMELRTKARRLQAESGLDLLIVDYLQLMQSSVQSRDANRVQEVSEISRGLKGLARELQVPVVALSQLSRQAEMRTNENKEPRLSDLRESGSIEQDADLVMFLWREKDRGEEDGQADDEGEVINLSLAKHRNGPTGHVKLWFKKRQTRFQQLEEDRVPAYG